MYDKDISAQYDRMSGSESLSAFGSLMRRVYLWMALGLGMTALTALFVVNTPQLVMAIFGSQILFWVLIFGELGLVLWLTAAASRLNFSTMGMLFALYCVLNGATLSVIFLVYEIGSIAQCFFITAGTFGAMSLVGYFTKRDLSSIGRILIMALIGVIIATVVNLFMRNSALDMIINYAGVLIFVGLTAYDTQKIKNMLLEAEQQADGNTLGKIALLGSLSLYLDFVNLFLYLLRIFGRRR